jgi:hypothetical protein
VLEDFLNPPRAVAYVRPIGTQKTLTFKQLKRKWQISFV